MITRHQFEAAYAARAGVTVEWLRERRVAIPVSRETPSPHCDYEGCEGWHMIGRSIVAEDIEDGLRPESDRDLLDPENTLT